jgi:hypothetical protein
MSRIFYVAANGNDEWDGLTEATPFKTINRVNQIRFQPGDELRFQRGDTFCGAIQLKGSGSEANPVKVGAYGNGPAPVITGASVIFQGMASGEACLQVLVADSVKQVFVNGETYELARIPAKGFYYIQQGDKLSLNDSLHLQEFGDLNGATARIRVVNWQYETAIVKSCTNGTLAFFEPMMYACPPRYGYLLDNHPAFLREPGQWYWDEKQQKLYIILKEVHLNSSLTIEAIQYDSGIHIEENSGYWNISELEICRFEVAGMYGATGSHHVAVRNCHIHDVQVYGIFCDLNTQYFYINDNCIEDIWGRGICTLESSNNRIVKNTVKNIGLKPGYGFDGVNNGVGIAVLKTEVTYRLSRKVLEKALAEGADIAVAQLLEPMVDLPYPDEKFVIEEIQHRVGANHLEAILDLLLPGIRQELEANRLYSTLNYVAWNKVSHTGYAGIRVDGTNSTVEYNLIEHTLLHMNDGGALYCWAQNEDYTHHNVFRRNIITNVVGNCEATPNDFSYAFGIYTDNKCHHIEISENIVTGAVGGILVNDEAHHQTISKNILYDNLYGLHFSEYFMPGTLTDCVAEDNLLFAKHRHQKALFVESRIGTDFRPAVFKGNTYANPYYPFPVMLMECINGVRVLKELDQKAWQELYPDDNSSVFIATDNHDAGGRRSVLLMNTTEAFQLFSLPSDISWTNLENKPVIGEIGLQPFEAAVLLQA